MCLQNRTLTVYADFQRLACASVQFGQDFRYTLSAGYYKIHVQIEIALINLRDCCSHVEWLLFHKSFFFFSVVVCTNEKRLCETLPLSTCKICFYWVKRKYQYIFAKNDLMWSYANVHSTSWRWINIESTFFQRCVPDGTVFTKNY